MRWFRQSQSPNTVSSSVIPGVAGNFFCLCRRPGCGILSVITRGMNVCVCAFSAVNGRGGGTCLEETIFCARIPWAALFFLFNNLCRRAELYFFSPHCGRGGSLCSSTVCVRIFSRLTRMTAWVATCGCLPSLPDGKLARTFLRVFARHD